MTNLKEMKKMAVKGVAAILIAANLMCAAAPVMAQDAPVAVTSVAEDNTVAGLEVIPEVDEALEDDAEDTAQTTATTEKEDKKDTSVVDDLKEKDKKNDESKKEDERKKLINGASEQVGEFLNNIINGKYNNTGDAVADLSLTTLKFVNDSVIKDLPYIGGLIHAIINGQMSEQKAKDTRLDKISEQLNMINQTIQSCTDQMIKHDDSMMQDAKIVQINNKYSTLIDDYKLYRPTFNNALKIFGEENADAEGHALDIERANGKLEKIYSKDNLGFYKEYMSFCKEIMCTGELVGRNRRYNPDIFGAFLQVVTYDKDGIFADLEFIDEQQALLDSVKGTCDYGYEMLYTVITTQCENKKGLRDSYKEAEKDIIVLLADESVEQQALLNSTKRDLHSKINDLDEEIEFLESQLEDLNAMHGKYIDFCNDNQDKIDARRMAFLDTCVAEYAGDYTLTVDGNVYNHFNCEEHNSLVYPSMNEEKSQIEYRDRFGNLHATQAVAKTWTEVNPYKIETGKVYRFQPCWDNRFMGYDETHDVLVEDVREVPDGIWGTLFDATNRTVFGKDIETGNQVAIEVCNHSGYYATERVVGPLKMCC